MCYGKKKGKPYNGSLVVHTLGSYFPVYLSVGGLLGSIRVRGRFGSRLPFVYLSGSVMVVSGPLGIFSLFIISYQRNSVIHNSTKQYVAVC